MTAHRFTFEGTDLPVFDHPYNTTATNERAVEVPIALTWLAGRTGRGVEVGNVLGHYDVDVDRLVVDKYEPGPGVLNTDLFLLEDQAPWVLSISTVEHVGDDVDDPTLAGKAIDHLRGLLGADGRLLITAGLGQNPTLDRLLLGDHDALYATTLVRVDDEWHQTEELTTRPYIGGGRGADAVWIGEYGP